MNEREVKMRVNVADEDDALAAIEFKKAIEKRLPNVRIVERCPDCQQGKIIRLGLCDRCEDKGFIERTATLDDIVRVLSVPTKILLQKQENNDER